jgi:hypothetical protein
MEGKEERTEQEKGERSNLILNYNPGDALVRLPSFDRSHTSL